MQIQPVDPRDEAAFDRWFAVYATANEEVWPGEPGWSMRELRERVLRRQHTHHEVHLLAERDGEPTGAGLASLPLCDNRHFAELEVVVSPAYRRVGTGSALLARFEQLAAADNRTVLAADIQARADAPMVPPGVPFAQAHGYRPVQRNYRRTLALPGDSARLDGLEEQCAPYAEDYRLRTWQDRCPDDLVGDLALLRVRMSTDAPLGELATGPEVWDVARVRDLEATVAGQGRTRLGAGAVTADGTMVAFTELVIPSSVPQQAYQWDTLVRAEHRGHRLGTLVKVANLRALAQVSPASRQVVTWNAEDNGPMVAVNEALGFQVVGTLTSWQRAL